MTGNTHRSPPPLAGEVGPRSGPGGGSSPKWKVTKGLRANARRLRHDSTDAEKAIWQALRAHRFGGLSFRRQTPIGNYIADFVCHSAKLVIELDGGQHFETAHTRKDAIRDAFFASKGFRVLRFANNDVMRNRQGVLETIVAAIAAAPSPTLPRKRGREKNVGARP